MTTPDVAWLALRAAYSFVFLNAAWQCGKSRAGIQWTIAEARVLFGDAAPILGPAGIAVMGLGGLSILLGLAAELGGLLLLAFLPLGAFIHARQRARASALADSLRPNLVASAGGPQSLDQLAISAQLAHYSSAAKNWSLMGPAAFFALMGSGPCSLVHLWGTT